MEAVKELVRLDDADSPATAMAKIVKALEDEQDAELVAQRVSEVIGLAKVALGGEEGLAAIRRLFETLAREQPIVVVFDDIHWGAPTFLDLDRASLRLDARRTDPVRFVLPGSTFSIFVPVGAGAS